MSADLTSANQAILFCSTSTLRDTESSTDTINACSSKGGTGTTIDNRLFRLMLT